MSAAGAVSRDPPQDLSRLTLGTGPDMPSLLGVLGALDRDLFAIIEHDLYPCAPDVPLPIAIRTRRYLGGCGLGPAEPAGPNGARSA